MPWTAESGTTYKLCLMDTNALSTASDPDLEECTGFRRLLDRGGIAPCLTVYNAIELRRKPWIFDRVLKLFAGAAIFLLKPRSIVLREELENYDSGEAPSALMHAFSSQGRDSSYDIISFFDTLFASGPMKVMADGWRLNEEETLEAWLASRSNFKEGHTISASGAEAYLKEAGLQSLCVVDAGWVGERLAANDIPNVERVPSLRVTLYSQYYRIFNPTWKRKPGEVTDVEIMAVAPYVDMIITEGFQADIFDKISRVVPQLADLEVLTLRDLRSA